MDIRAYILSVVAAAAICAMVSVVVNNKTAAGKIAGILCSIFLTITALSPIISIRFQSLTKYLGDLSASADRYVEDGKRNASRSTADIIKTQTESYIFDKANRMGLEIAVEVELDEDNNSIPCGVFISGDISPYAKQMLGSFLEDDLGISKENQKWS